MDFHRSVRQGAAEVIYGAGKTPEQISGIARTMGERGCRNILVTRISQETADREGQSVPLDYHPEARLGLAYPGEQKRLGNIVVATGGTSDMPVAEEAALTAEAMGNQVTRLYDVGSGRTPPAALQPGHPSCLPGAWSLWRGWRGPWPRSSAGWWTAPSSRCPPAWAMGPASADCPPS